VERIATAREQTLQAPVRFERNLPLKEMEGEENQLSESGHEWIK
jgi:hypothetical protein